MHKKHKQEKQKQRHHSAEAATTGLLVLLSRSLSSASAPATTTKTTMPLILLLLLATASSWSPPLGLVPTVECTPGAGGSSVSGALPALVTRATDSLSALLSSRSSAPALAPATGGSGASSNLPTQQQQQQSLGGAALASSNSEQSQASPAAATSNGGAAGNTATRTGAGSTLLQPIQAQLSAIQTQAQRQISHLNGLMLNGASQLAHSPLAAHAANLTGSGAQYGNVLEVLSNVGKAIQQQIGAAQQVQIVSNNPLAQGEQQQLANTRKNEYQSVAVDSTPTGPATNNSTSLSSGLSVNQYREQGEQIRQEIVRRAGQLQQVVASSMDVLKNNGDLIVRRLLEQLNNRLDQAKSKADKIINEPATNEVAIKALHTINLGLNNLNNIITNIVNRLDIASKDLQTQSNLQAAASSMQNNLSQRVGGSGGGGPSLLFDREKFKLNFHQIGQQFSSALSAAAAQQQRFQQQLAGTTSGAGNNKQMVLPTSGGAQSTNPLVESNNLNTQPLHHHHPQQQLQQRQAS